jgi:hypothetical protein
MRKPLVLLLPLVLMNAGCDSRSANEAPMLGKIQNAIRSHIDSETKNSLAKSGERYYFNKEDPKKWHESKNYNSERREKRLVVATSVELAYKNIFSSKISNYINNVAKEEKNFKADSVKNLFSDDRLNYKREFYSQNDISGNDFNAFVQTELKKFSDVKVSEFSVKRIIPKMDSEAEKAIKGDFSLANFNGYDIYADIFFGGNSKDGKAIQEKYNVLFSFQNCEGEKINTCDAKIKINFRDLAERIGLAAFKEVTADSKLAQTVTTYPRLEALRRGGYALAIEDFNNDGILDMFVGQYGKAELLIGKADGTFEKAPEGMIPDITLAKSAAFVDLDGSGYKDLVVARFSGNDLRGDIKIFKNVAGKKFEEVQNAVVSNELRAWAMPLAISDFNNDGVLDFYVGFPGERDFSVLSDFNIGEKFVVNGIFINNGGHKFEDATKKYLEHTNDNIFPHGALATDITGNGLQDIVVIDDRKNLSPVYINEGKGKFTRAEKLMNIVNYGYGMGVDSADLTNSGKMDLVFSNIMLDASERVESALVSIAPANAVVPLSLKKALRVLVNDGKGNFNQLISPDLDFAGEGAAGVSFIDYDGDGLVDIYLTNGLWSGNDKDKSIDSEFAMAESLKLIEIDSFEAGVGVTENPVETRSGFMKTLQNDRVDGKTLSFGGHQRNRLFKNLGNNEFIEVGFLEGADSIADGYIPVVADINRDGLPDLIIRNCDPGIPEAHTFPVVQYYQNQLTGRSAGVAVRLKGNKSNIHGIGAKIFLTTEDKNSVVTTQLREIKGNNSAVQAPMIGYFSIPNGHKIKKLEVRWPSNEISTLRNIEAGEILVEEPRGRLSAN